MSSAKRHHIVPKFYLSGFADEAGHVGVLDLETRKIHTSAVTNAGLEVNFYSVSSQISEEQDIYEKYLSSHEGDAANAFKKLFAGTWPISPSDRMAISTWIAYQHFRVKARRTSQEETQALLIRILVQFGDRQRVRDWIESGEGRKISDAAFEWEFNDLTKPSGPDIKMDSLSHIRVIEELVPVAQKLVFDASWTLISFERKSLISNDHPTSLFPPENHPESLGIGVATAGGWLVPLNRKYGLEVKYSQLRRDSKIQGTSAIAEILNKRTLEEARRFIYFHPQDVGLVESIEIKPRNKELLPIDEGLFEVAKSENYSSSNLPTVPSNLSGASLSLDNLPWPIPGRINSRPADL